MKSHKFLLFSFLSIALLGALLLNKKEDTKQLKQFAKLTKQYDIAYSNSFLQQRSLLRKSETNRLYPKMPLYSHQEFVYAQ